MILCFQKNKEKEYIFLLFHVFVSWDSSARCESMMPFSFEKSSLLKRSDHVIRSSRCQW